MRSPRTTLAPKNGWLEYDRFLLGYFGLFSGAFAVSFQGCSSCEVTVRSISLSQHRSMNLQIQKKPGFGDEGDLPHERFRGSRHRIVRDVDVNWWFFPLDFS